MNTTLGSIPVTSDNFLLGFPFTEYALLPEAVIDKRGLDLPAVTLRTQQERRLSRPPPHTLGPGGVSE